MNECNVRKNEKWMDRMSVKEGREGVNKGTGNMENE